MSLRNPRPVGHWPDCGCEGCEYHRLRAETEALLSRAEAAEKRAEEADGKLDAALNDIACGRRCEDELRADLAATTKERDEARSALSASRAEAADLDRKLTTAMRAGVAMSEAYEAARAEVERLTRERDEARAGYRCVDCDVVFTREGLRAHCEDDLSKARAMIESMRGAPCPRCAETEAALAAQQRGAVANAAEANKWFGEAQREGRARLAAAAEVERLRGALTSLERQADGLLRTMAVEIGKVADARRETLRWVLGKVRSALREPETTGGEG